MCVPPRHLPPIRVAPPRAPPQLSVFASGDAIPNHLVMDLRGLKAGAKIMASDVQLNEGLRLVRGRG